MNAKQAKRLRKRAKELTPHCDEVGYHDMKTKRLNECTRGAYQALKKGRFKHVAIQE